MTTEDSGPAAAVGQRVRLRRLEADLTVAELARRVGVSSPFVSQVETGRSSLSISALYRFATALGCSPYSLLGSVAVASHHLRPEEGPRIRSGAGPQPQWPRLLTDSGEGGMLEAYHYVLTPDDDRQEWFEHPGEDLVYVVRGSVAVLFGDGREHVLAAGDSLHHGGAVPHRWALRGEEPAEVLLSVAVPPA